MSRIQARARSAPAAPSMMMLANYSTNTGYAWSTIEQVYAGVAERLRGNGARIVVCFASLAGGSPRSLARAPVDVIEFPFQRSRGSLLSMIRFAALLRRNRVRLLYLTDQPTWSWRYFLFRLAGVRRIVIHDRNSGHRHPRSRAHLRFKRLLHRTWLAADRYIAVSAFVANRLTTVNGVPHARARIVYNGVELSPMQDDEGNGPGALMTNLRDLPTIPVL